MKPLNAAIPSSSSFLTSRRYRAEGGTKRTLLRVDVAAEVHERLNRFGHERRGLACIRERVRPRPDRGFRAGLKDLRLADARVAVVDRPQDGDRAAVLACVADVELAAAAQPVQFCGRLAHDGVPTKPRATFAAAWATESWSAKPTSFWTSLPGRAKKRTDGSWSTPNCFVNGAAARWSRTFTRMKPAFAARAPSWASETEYSSTFD